MSRWVNKSQIDCQQGAVRAVRYNVDGNYALTAGSDRTIKLWNPTKESPNRSLQTFVGECSRNLYPVHVLTIAVDVRLFHTSLN